MTLVGSSTQRATRMIAEWVQYYIDALPENDSVIMGEIADLALEHFLHDRAFIRGPITDLIRMAALRAAQDAGRRSRIHLSASPNAVFAATPVSPDGTRVKPAPSNRWWQWLEHVNDRHMRLAEMTREDLLQAAQERTTRGDREMAIADLWQALASKLEGGERVRDRFTPEEIEALAAERARVNTVKAELREAMA